MFFDPIARQRPYCSGRDFITFFRMLFRGNLLEGNYVKEFESDFANIYNIKHSLSFDSCRSSFSLLIDALGVKMGDAVILPAFNLSAFPNILKYKGIEPIFVDIDRKTLTIDPQQIEKSITPKTKAIVAVHLFGNTCNMDSIMSIAKKHNLFVIEDCANAFMTKYKNNFVGTYGDVACFSLGHSKDVPTFGGGMVITNNDSLCKSMQLAYDTEFTVPPITEIIKSIIKIAFLKVATSKIIFLLFIYPIVTLFSLIEFDFVGHFIEEKDELIKKISKKRLTNFQAYIGIQKLKNNNNMQKKRVRLAKLWNNVFSNIDSIEPSTVRAEGEHAYWNYTLHANNRTKLLQKLILRGIDAKKIDTYDCNNYEIFKEFRKDCPVSLEASNTLLALPIYHYLTDNDARFISKSLININEDIGSGIKYSDSEVNSMQKVLLLRLEPSAYKKSNHPIGYRPPYTLKYVEALLQKKHGYSTKCIDQRIANFSLKEIEGEIQDWEPNIIVFDVSTLNASTSGALCKKVVAGKSKNPTRTMCIGQEASANISQFRKDSPQYDIVLAGESELEVNSIIERLKTGETPEEIKNDYREGDLENKTWTVKDLDCLPFIHYDQESLRGYSFVYPLPMAKKLRWGHMLTSRGCPHHCIFCSQIMKESYSKDIRFRSASNVVDEMENLLALGANIISFDDENFTTSKAHVSAICNEIIKRNLKVKWIAHARVDEMDKPLFELFSRGGCVLIRVGIETGNSRILHLLEKTKYEREWFKKSEETVELAKSCGISVACLFMVGCHTETLEEMHESITFAKKLNPDIIQVSYCTPFPGSKMNSMVKKPPKTDITELYHYNIPTFNLSNMTDKELEGAQSLFYREFLLRPLFLIKHFSKNLFFYLFNHEVFLKLLRIKEHIR